MLKMIGGFVVCVAVWSAVAVVVVAAIDPACGPDGTSQLQCMSDIVHDLLPW